jgi:hypothetical protein
MSTQSPQSSGDEAVVLRYHVPMGPGTGSDALKALADILPASDAESFANAHGVQQLHYLCAPDTDVATLLILKTIKHTGNEQQGLQTFLLSKKSFEMVASKSGLFILGSNAEEADERYPGLTEFEQGAIYQRYVGVIGDRDGLNERVVTSESVIWKLRKDRDRTGLW